MKKHTLTRSLTMFGLAAALAFGTTSCFQDLDREPEFGYNTATAYSNASNIRGVLAKLYGGLVLTGQAATGKPDITGGDEGATSYSRLLWKLEELTTDEAVVAWNDGSIQDLNTDTWTTANDLIRAMFARIYFQVAQCNEFIRETSDANLSDRGVGGSDADQIRKMRSEVRFLRALSYYHALDMYGNVPLVLEDAELGALPRQVSRAELFAFVERELLEIEPSLENPRTVYGRADKAAAWMLLSRLYLNAETYLGPGQGKYTEALTYTNQVLNAGYSLAPIYKQLFGAENDISAASEIIFPISCDGLRTQSFGGTTFLVHASAGGQLRGDTLGVSSNEAWGGIRAKKTLPLRFGDVTMHVPDARARFFTRGQSLEIATTGDITSFSKGYGVKKWTNLRADGTAGSNPTFVDTDIPFFRLGEANLNYAEAVLRNAAGGDRGTAVNKINELRARAGAALITDADLTLEFLLEERSREMYWEGTRRTDLVRFGAFTSGTYLWPWKGEVKDGRALPTHFDLYPIPSSDLISNPTLVQNPGY